jgi:AcrR family transcriptional regulator
VTTTQTRARAVRTRHSREQTRAGIVRAATELVRERSYQELSVGEVMERAGFERTIFYRHFDGLGDLLLSAGREAIERLYEAEVDLSAAAREDGAPGAVRAAMEPAVAVYREHGPLLRALAEAAAAGDEEIAAGHERMHARFDELVAGAIEGLSPDLPAADARERAHALNLMNTAYLLDAFGREPRVSEETAGRTVTEIWTAVIIGNRSNGGN